MGISALRIQYYYYIRLAFDYPPTLLYRNIIADRYRKSILKAMGHCLVDSLKRCRSVVMSVLQVFSCPVINNCQASSCPGIGFHTIHVSTGEQIRRR